eukprot:m.69127 g.69127  ORF g.69127 m.69127 type:complete len:1372 (+) comp8561_c0_seq1:202-4317(+)
MSCTTPPWVVMIMACVGTNMGADAAPLVANALSGSGGGDGDEVLLFGPGWTSVPPRMALEGVTIPRDTGGVSASEPVPFAVWENYAEIPRAVEPKWAAGGATGADPEGYFFADTQGSLWMLEPKKAIHALVPRTPGLGVDQSILSLAYHATTSKLYYTVNTTIRVLQLSPDGTKAVGPPAIVADFGERGVQSLVVLWPEDGSGSAAVPEAFFCLFNNGNTSDGGSLVRASLEAPTRYSVLVNSTLSVLSGAPFGDALPRISVDKTERRVYFVVFGIGVSYVDIDTPGPPTRVPIRTDSRTPFVCLSLTLVPSVESADSVVLALTSLTGRIGTVPVTGGDVNWVSVPCAPSGGCSYRQLWDLRVIGDIEDAETEERRQRLAATWISVTDLDESRATVRGASIRTLTFGNNFTELNITSEIDAWHQGSTGIEVVSDKCVAYYTQNSHSSIYSSPLDPLQPANTSYTYKNFRFNPTFTLDTSRDRAWWYQQYENPHAAGDNGYGLQLMSANLNDLNSRATALSGICNTHSGDLIVDPKSGDVVFQSYGSRGFYDVQHYCYQKASGGLARHFYTQLDSYNAVNVAVDWGSRVMYVSGTAYYTDQSAIRRVSLDAPSPTANKEEVVASNTSANAMAVAGGRLYYVQVTPYGQLKFTSSVLYSCAPKSDPTSCSTTSATNLSAIPWAFSDQFSSIKMFAPSDDKLVFVSRRGNSIATVVSSYPLDHVVNKVEATWEPVWVSPFNLPSAIGGTPSKYFFLDSTLSTFGSFTPVTDKTDVYFKVPFEILGHVRPLSSLGSSQPYPNGASGRWGTQFTATDDTWYWISPGKDNRLVVHAADMADPNPREVATLAFNASSDVLAIDESAKHIYYVRRTNSRAGVCGSYNGYVADDLVRSSFGDTSASEPDVIFEQPNGWCFGTSSVAFDNTNNKIYYSLVNRYSQFMGYNYLACLDIKTGRSTTMDWGFPRNTNHQILRLSNDVNMLWSWGCVPRSNGCTSRMFRINVGADSPPTANWTNATIDAPGPGLSDFSVRDQPKDEFVFGAYTSSQTSRTVRGIYRSTYVPGAALAWEELLLPVDINNIDMDMDDKDSGMFVAALLPVTYTATDGIVLLRGPTSGVGRADGKTLISTIIPWPTDLPAALKLDPTMQQLEFQPPNRLMFAWGRSNCIQDEIWETEVSADHTATVPKQSVSALLSSQQLQSQSDGTGGTDLMWVKCSCRVVFANVPEGEPADAPMDYSKLKHAWLDVDTGAVGSPYLRTFAHVGDNFVLGYLNGPVFHAILEQGVGDEDYHFGSIKLLSNDSAWLPVQSTTYGERVFLGERNATGSNGRILSIDFGAEDGVPKLDTFVHTDNDVTNLGIAPARCIPDMPTVARVSQQ